MNNTTIYWSLHAAKGVSYSDLAEALVRTYRYFYSEVPCFSNLIEFVESKEYRGCKSTLLEELFPFEVNEYTDAIDISDLDIKDTDEFYKCLNKAIENYYVSYSSGDTKCSI